MQAVLWGHRCGPTGTFTHRERAAIVRQFFLPPSMSIARHLSSIDQSIIDLMSSNICRLQYIISITIHLIAEFVSTNEATMEYTKSLESIGEEILTWADPDNQFRGHTQVRRSLARFGRKSFDVASSFCWPFWSIGRMKLLRVPLC